MGNSFHKQKPKRKHVILIQGLDGAGKTTLLYKWKLDEVVTDIPSFGLNAETITYNSVPMVMWDVAGRGRMRPLYRHYYRSTDVLVYVVDSNDQERLDTVKYELHSVTKEEKLKDTSFLILANKQDIPSSSNPVQIAEALELHKVEQNCYILGISAITGEGLNESLEWIITALAGNMGNKVSENKNEYSNSWKA